MNVKVCLDVKGYDSKPKDQVGIITGRIAKNERVINIKELAELIGVQGYAFTPATFGGRNRSIENFEEMQLFALDFDSGVSYTEIKARADEYCIPVSFAYHTFSSSPEHEKFRVVLVHDGAVKDRDIAKLILEMFKEIFPEQDSACNEVSRLFFGGKALIYLDENALFNISTLEREYIRHISKRDTKYYTEMVKKMAKKYQIKLASAGSMAIYRSDFMDDINDNTTTETVPSSKVYIINGTLSNYYIIRSDYKADTSGNIAENKKKRDRHKKYRNVDFDIEKANCRLFKRMMNDEELHHQEYFLLMLNLIQIEGGETLFLEKVGKHKDLSDWNYYVAYAKKKGYHYCSCDKLCPYSAECTHGYNMLQTIFGKILPNNSIEYSTMAEAQKQLEQNFRNAVSAKDEKIHLIKAQTAMGKSSIYIRVVKKMKLPSIIAVSTNRLKNEIYNKLKGECELPVVMTPSLDEMEFPEEVIQEIKAAYQRGCMDETSAILQKYRIIWQKSKDGSDKKHLHNCDEYLEFNKKYLEQGCYHIVTTHAKLLTIKQDLLWKFGSIIIDEDILFSLLRDTFKVSRKDVKKLKNHVNPDFKIELDKILAAETGTCNLIQYKGNRKPLKMEELNRYKIKGNVNALIQAQSYYISEKNSDVVCFAPRRLYTGCKYIVLSATLNEWMYEKYFSNFEIVRYPVKYARYKGKLIQFSNYSLSRTSLSQREKRVFDAVKYICPDNIPIISFKSKEKNDYDLHFGNAEGVNVLEGQDIAVVGTPHYPDCVYKLIALALNPTCDCNERIHKRRTINEEFRFTMSSFEDRTIQEVQLYLIRSELEQCIGRARILRRSCMVFLFSSFPCSQAQFIQSDYLLKENLERYRSKFHFKE